MHSSELPRALGLSAFSAQFCCGHSRRSFSSARLNFVLCLGSCALEGGYSASVALGINVEEVGWNGNG